MAISKELWLETIVNGLVPATSFLSRSKNFDEFVEYNKLNLAEAGVDPKVLIDNATYPIGTTSREDIPHELILHTFDTENTVVRNIEEKESSYDKMASVTASHKNALIRKSAAFAAHAWAPQKNTDTTPVLKTSGATTKRGSKAFTFADFLEMDRLFRSFEIDPETLTVVLSPAARADLMAEDMKLYKQILSDKRLFSFLLFDTTVLPTYNRTSGNKNAFGSAVTEEDGTACLVYSSDYVCRAKGDLEMFVKYKDPEQRGDVVGFQERFTACPITGKFIGAIYEDR
ncbi:MAG: hypothetical protein K2I87_07225 [Bacteroidales bacterium]|nr:hypothetical protein [Bacteroidales bacterium]